MPKVKINNQELDLQAGLTIIQACELAEIEIPRFCYHERLSIAGNCRMCLVEVEKYPKPVASCAMPIADGMVIHTDSPMVRKAREGVMEFLLINHPLDCPICDQGGECDLQDQAYHYGRAENRFLENKRSIVDKYLGPLIQTHMNRCIHCTRCVRFLNEVAGVEELGAVGRGENTEITMYIEKALSSEVSANIIDLCPVGALVSKPYAFRARSWELRKTETIDVLDAVGSNIRVDTKGLEVMRILPRLNEFVNEEWISDKTRFSYDGLKLQRLDRPMIKKEGRLVYVSWIEALDLVAKKLIEYGPKQVAALAGNFADCESIFALKNLLTLFGCNNFECRTDGMEVDHNNRGSYLFNTSIMGIEDADLCLLIGAKPRYEATIINTRIRKRYLAGNFTVASLGEEIDHTYGVEYLGNNLEILQQILDDKHPFSTKLKSAVKPMLIIGSTILRRSDAKAILSICYQIAQKYNFINQEWNGWNILHSVASRVGALDLGFVPTDNQQNIRTILTKVKEQSIKMVYLLNCDELKANDLKDAFVVYQGHHGDEGAQMADIILPSAAYTEKNSTYLNIEGRVQQTLMAVPPPSEAKEDWLIIVMLANYLELKLPYNNLAELRIQMIQKFPQLGLINQISKSQLKSLKVENSLDSQPISSEKIDYYLDNPISRASKIMSNCSQIHNKVQG